MDFLRYIWCLQRCLYERLSGNLLILPHSAQSICRAVWKGREQRAFHSPKLPALWPVQHFCGTRLEELLNQGNMIGHSLEQRPLCLHSTGYKHSSWEKLKSLFKGWLLKFSTLHEKSLVYQNNPLILWRQKSCLLRSHTIYYFPLYSAHVCYQ